MQHSEETDMASGKIDRDACGRIAVASSALRNSRLVRDWTGPSECPGAPVPASPYTAVTETQRQLRAFEKAVDSLIVEVGARTAEVAIRTAFMKVTRAQRVRVSGQGDKIDGATGITRSE
jgi:hypothetical protein